MGRLSASTAKESARQPRRVPQHLPQDAQAVHLPRSLRPDAGQRHCGQEHVPTAHVRHFNGRTKCQHLYGQNSRLSIKYFHPRFCDSTHQTVRFVLEAEHNTVSISGRHAAKWAWATLFALCMPELMCFVWCLHRTVFRRVKRPTAVQFCVVSFELFSKISEPRNEFGKSRIHLNYSSFLICQKDDPNLNIIRFSSSKHWTPTAPAL